MTGPERRRSWQFVKIVKSIQKRGGMAKILRKSRENPSKSATAEERKSFGSINKNNNWQRLEACDTKSRVTDGILRR